MKNLRIIYRCFGHINLLTEDIIDRLKNTGCKEIGIGIESGSDKILKIINKGFTSSKAKDIVKMIKNKGISVKTFFVVGLPGEDDFTINETKKWLDEVKPNDVDFTIYTPFPGTDIYDNKDKFDINFDIDKNLNFYKTKQNKYKCNVSTFKLSSFQILNIRDNLERQYKS